MSYERAELIQLATIGGEKHFFNQREKKYYPITQYLLFQPEDLYVENVDAAFMDASDALEKMFKGGMNNAGFWDAYETLKLVIEPIRFRNIGVKPDTELKGAREAYFHERLWRIENFSGQTKIKLKVSGVITEMLFPKYYEDPLEYIYKWELKFMGIDESFYKRYVEIFPAKEAL
jgi:hypothetical protein